MGQPSLSLFKAWLQPTYIIFWPIGMIKIITMVNSKQLYFVCSCSHLVSHQIWRPIDFFFFLSESSNLLKCSSGFFYDFIEEELKHLLVTWLCNSFVFNTRSAIHRAERINAEKTTNDEAKNVFVENQQQQKRIVLKKKRAMLACSNHQINISITVILCEKRH